MEIKIQSGAGTTPQGALSIIVLIPCNFGGSIFVGYIFTEHQFIYHPRTKQPVLGYCYQDLLFIYSCWNKGKSKFCGQGLVFIFCFFIRLIPRVNNNHWFNTHQYFGDKYMLVTYSKNVHWFIIILKTAYFGRFLSWFGGSTKFLNDICPKGDWGSLGWYITMVWYHF